MWLSCQSLQNHTLLITLLITLQYLQITHEKCAYKCDFLNHTFITHSKCDHMSDHTFIFAWVIYWMPREEVSTFQFSWCSIWKPGESNFWVKICLAQEQTLFDFVQLCYYCCYKWILRSKSNTQCHFNYANISIVYNNKLFCRVRDLKFDRLSMPV